MWQVWEFVQEMTRREALPRPGDDLVVMGGPPCQVGQMEHLSVDICVAHCIVRPGSYVSAEAWVCRICGRSVWSRADQHAQHSCDASEQPAQAVRSYTHELPLSCC